jgi:hypothetical protein
MYNKSIVEKLPSNGTNIHDFQLYTPSIQEKTRNNLNSLTFGSMNNTVMPAEATRYIENYKR